MKHRIKYEIKATFFVEVDEPAGNRNDDLPVTRQLRDFLDRREKSISSLDSGFAFLLESAGRGDARLESGEATILHADLQDRAGNWMTWEEADEAGCDGETDTDTCPHCGEWL